MFFLPMILAMMLTVPAETVSDAFAGRTGAFVLVDCVSGEVYRNDPAACAEKAAPCSTFKIWNTAIGLETGMVADPDLPFWKWDGQKRSIEAWNADQTLRSAIAVSCVPAYQALARKIGTERMQDWLEKLGYGDRDLSAGLDVFWLPEPGRKTILVSPDEQAALIVRLVAGKLPLSASTLATLKSVLKLKETERGTFYGKTGSSGDDAGIPALGWFVGYVEAGGKTHAFACLLKGRGVMGRDARAAVERILSAQRIFP